MDVIRQRLHLVLSRGRTKEGLRAVAKKGKDAVLPDGRYKTPYGSYFSPAADSTVAGQQIQWFLPGGTESAQPSPRADLQ